MKRSIKCWLHEWYPLIIGVPVYLTAVIFYTYKYWVGVREVVFTTFLETRVIKVFPTMVYLWALPIVVVLAIYFGSKLYRKYK